MKTLFSILTFFLTSSLNAQTNWILTSTKERLYTEISSYGSVILLGPSESDDDPISWKKVDTFFKNMPLKLALQYYNDSIYTIRVYSFLKILGTNDQLAFKLLKRYINDSTNIIYQVGDLGGEIQFNKLLVEQYEHFIDSKYYWCDTLYLFPNNYFRKAPLSFTKMNYASWPKILTELIKFLKPYNIESTHKLTELQNYHGIKYFHGR